MDEVLRVEELTKRFPGVLAVDRLTFGLARGELLAVLGENGAGKSTLTKMISGVILPDSGRIVLDGREFVCIPRMIDQGRASAMVYQELSMVGSMSIAENIFANRQPINGIGLIQRGKLYRDTSDLHGEIQPEDQSADAREAPLDGTAAAHRDSEGNLAESEGADPRRADQLPHGDGGGAAVRDHREAEEGGALLHLHHAQAVGGVQARRPGTGHAGREIHRHEDARRGHDDGPHHPDGRP